MVPASACRLPYWISPFLRPTCPFEVPYSERVGASEQSVRSAEWAQT